MIFLRRDAVGIRRVRVRRRTGMVLVMSLITLMLVVSLLVTMLKASLLDRQKLLVERDVRQTELLVDAGLQRAIAQLAADPGYRGETWNLSADEIIGTAEGRVTISARPSNADSAANRRVRIVAEYPFGSATSIRRTRTFTLPAQSPSAQE